MSGIFEFSILFWLLGFVFTKVASKTTGGLFQSPLWFFYLCGAPKNKKLPPYTLSGLAVVWQLWGLITIAMRLIFFFVDLDNSAKNFISFTVGFASATIIALIVRRRKVSIS